MPGLIPHLIAGTVIYFIGLFYYRVYFQKNDKNKLLLAFVCFISSLIPDVFLVLYYITHLFSFKMFLKYHVFTHIIITPIVIIAFTVLIFRLDIKRKPIWIIGIGALFLHMVMDLLIKETNLFI